MRLITVIAPTSQQAVAGLRAKLGPDAVIVTTQTTEDGQVRITGAMAEEDVDLADVLSPSIKHDAFDWLAPLGDFHEWPLAWHDGVGLHLDDASISDPCAVLAAMLRARWSFCGSSEPSDRPMLLSGPPGSGKTATLAKLAAGSVLDGKSVDVLTLDVERAGAIEQLTSLLAPLELKPIHVPKFDDLSGILASCSSELILIDTPGTNPFGKADLKHLSMALNSSGVELVLVLAAGGSPSDSADIGQCYAALGAERMMVTKLDAAKRLGGLLAAADAGLAFSDAGIGPTIGDGFCELTAEGFARLLLCRFQQSATGDQAR
jgi:flagellar biosynthesis protein FlhF